MRKRVVSTVFNQTRYIETRLLFCACNVAILFRVGQKSSGPRDFKLR